MKKAISNNIQESNLLAIEQQARLDAESARNKLYRLQYVTSALSQALTSKEIAELIVSLGSATLSASAGSVWLFDKEEKLHNIVYTGYKKEAMEGIEDVRKKDSTPTLDAIKKKKPIILRSLKDRQQLYPHTADLYSLSQKEGFIAMPLLIGETVLGAVNFAFDTYKDFTPEEKEFIFTLTQQCAQALDRARMYEKEKEDKDKLEKVTERIKKLQQIAEELSHALTIGEIENVIISTAMDALGVTIGGLWLLSADGKNLHAVGMKGVSKKRQKEWEVYSVTREMPKGYAVITQKEVFFENKEQHAKRFPKSVSKTFSEGYATLPLIRHKKVLGVLNFGFPMQKIFTPDDKDFLIHLAAQCAQALDRALLYENEEEEEMYLQKLSSLQEMTKQLSQAVTLPEVAHIIVEQGTKALGGTAGEVVSYTAEQDLFRVIAYKKFPAFYMKPLMHKDFSVSKSQDYFVVDAIQKRVPIFVSAKEKVPAHYSSFHRVMNIVKCHSAAYLPLIINNKVIGVLDLVFKEKKVFTEEEKGFMFILAENCAQALDRANGYQQIKEYAEQLKRNEARFRSLIENSADAIMLVDKRFTVLYRSQSSRKITGEDPESRVGQPALTLVKKEDRTLARKALQKLSQLPTGATAILRFRRNNTDKKDQWLEATGTNLLKNPAIEALVINYRDVTDKVEAEEALKKSRDELDIILQNVVDAVVVTDTAGHIIYANPAAFSFEGMSISTGRPAHTLSYPNLWSNFKGFYDEEGVSIPTQKLPIRRILAGEAYVSQVMRIEFHDNREEQWRLVKASPVYNAKGNIDYVVSIYSDITQEKQKEKLKDEFISTASHELKTPITSAKLYAGMLHQRLLETHDEEAFGMVTKVDVQLTKLTHLINDLLDVSRISAGRVQFRFATISLNFLLKEVVEEMQLTTLNHTLLLSGVVKSPVYADPERLQQAVMNLISNAIKYSPRSNKVDITLSESKKTIRICVKDYGIGIRPHNLDKIFQPFYRETQVAGARFPGLGLGLHISSEIVNKHNGKISVESTYGKGSIFCITLPKQNGKTMYLYDNDGKTTKATI